MSDLAASRILVVYDDVELTVMLGQYLQAEDLRIETVHNSEEALEKIEHRFPRSLVDHELAAAKRRPKGNRVERARGIELGADDYIASI